MIPNPISSKHDEILRNYIKNNNAGVEESELSG